MWDRIATVIIEPRSLVREALVSLMESHSCQIICSVGSTADIDRSVLKEEPGLVILGAMPTDRVADATSSIRRHWQDAKIIMLFEKASSKDLQKLLASRLDACIPALASPRILLETLKLIVCERLRILMVNDSTIPQVIDPEQGEDNEALPEGHLSVASLTSSSQGRASVAPCARDLLATGTGDLPASRTRNGLSGREEQILQALVQGQSNKMIARECTITEATVKAHLKSICRKIQVVNRTQAAIWALQNVGDTMPKGMRIASSVVGFN